MQASSGVLYCGPDGNKVPVVAEIVSVSEQMDSDLILPPRDGRSSLSDDRGSNVVETELTLTQKTRLELCMQQLNIREDKYGEMSCLGMPGRHFEYVDERDIDFIGPCEGEDEFERDDYILYY